MGRVIDDYVSNVYQYDEDYNRDSLEFINEQEYYNEIDVQSI